MPFWLSIHVSFAMGLFSLPSPDRIKKDSLLKQAVL
jgi:hypothetical protein